VSHDDLAARASFIAVSGKLWSMDTARRHSNLTDPLPNSLLVTSADRRYARERLRHPELGDGPQGSPKAAPRQPQGSPEAAPSASH
jgi:hypothetical protein